MRDDVNRMIDALRVKTMALPEGFSSAPILDTWEFRTILPAVGAPPCMLKLAGRISGDRRFSAGEIIFTSTVEEIDARSAIRWARTRNTLYRLGAPALAVPFVAAVALAADWVDALTLLALTTGEHTLDSVTLATYLRLLDIGTSRDWTKRRSLARAVAAAMDDAQRFALRDAWILLGADPREQPSAQAVRNLLVAPAALSEELGAILAAWEAFADGNHVLIGDEQDHIAGAYFVGERLLHGRRLPLFVRVALQDSWHGAWNLAKRELPQKLVDEAIRRGIEDWENGERLRIARALAALRGWGGDGGEHEIMRLLSTDPADGDHVVWVVERLNKFPHGDDIGIARRRWHALADASAAEKPAFPCDPFASARAAHEKAFSRATNAIEEPPDGAPEPPGVVVLPRLGGTSKNSSGKEVDQEFKSIVGRRLPLLTAPDLVRVRAILVDEFPHLTGEIDLLLTGLVERQPVRMPPTLLVGDPGGGKSRLARRLAEELRMSLHRFDGSGSADNAFAGTPRRWSSGEHCVPLEAVRRATAANPIVLIDEVDKSGNSRHNGSLDRALLPFLEQENARAYPDPYVQAECDLSHVNYLLTANDATLLPGPLRDRLRIAVLPRPSVGHLPQLARSIVADVARTRGGDARWFPPLEDHELAVAEGLWRGGSVRRLHAVIERILAHREQSPRH